MKYREARKMIQNVRERNLGDTFLTDSELAFIISLLTIKLEVYVPEQLERLEQDYGFLLKGGK